jgi:tRNA-dihydrouridine synthase
MLAAALKIGRLSVPNAAFLAPMTGVTDLPFRRLAHRLGAGLVVSEMVACEDLVRQRADVVRRASGSDLKPYVIQLVGRESRWMEEGARIAEGLGADVVDINKGRIAREHVDSMLSHYGTSLGLRNARKHIGWYLEKSGRAGDTVKSWRKRLFTEESAPRVLQGLADFYAEACEAAA